MREGGTSYLMKAIPSSVAVECWSGEVGFFLWCSPELGLGRTVKGTVTGEPQEHAHDKTCPVHWMTV